MKTGLAVQNNQKERCFCNAKPEKRILRSKGKRFIIRLKTFTLFCNRPGENILQMTISDIAKMAGVSSAAVSRYLNNGPLSEQKRAAIREVVEKTGYHPDTAAQTLRTGKVNQIGVIVPSIGSQSVGQITAGIAAELEARSYLLLLGNTGLDPQRELGYLTAMQRDHVAGIILLGSCYTPHLAQSLKNCRVPVVVTGQRFPDTACVYNDDRNAARDLARLMVARGRKNIVYIGGNERDQATGVQRRTGVQDALNEAGLNGEALPRTCCEAFSLDEGERCMKELLTRCPELDGVVCVTDAVAFGAMRALRQAGRKIGADVSLAGVGDSWAGSVCEPGLTTVQFYQRQVGEEAARILLQMLEEKGNGGPMRQVTLGYRVVERGSI